MVMTMAIAGPIRQSQKGVPGAWLYSNPDSSLQHRMSFFDFATVSTLRESQHVTVHLPLGVFLTKRYDVP
jgi:hypothetical protein